jgi:HlyD family secretion protein
MEGVVISREVDVGQTVAASLNAPTLFTLAQDLRQMRIEAQVSEADVGGVSEGQAVTFTVDAYPTRTFSGTVSQVRFAPVTDQGVVNYIAIVDVANDDLKLRPGMTANATIMTARRENVLRLPNAAMRFRPPEDVVVEVPERKAQTDGHAASVDRPNPGERSSRGEGQGGVPDEARRAQWKRREGRGSRGANGADEAARRTVYVQDEQGKLVGKSVELGISDGSWTEMRGTVLKEGDRIVTGIQTEADTASSDREGSSSPFMPGQPPRGMH